MAHADLQPPIWPVCAFFVRVCDKTMINVTVHEYVFKVFPTHLLRIQPQNSLLAPLNTLYCAVSQRGIANP